ncbi:uncharacterized protein LOC117223947 [Megalopta genalis]|uniref:uncharacterized protein LOC117223947 n=1 Tax=Megalopta genalis TaxID=115081 RepID=UPI003FD01443
MATLKGIFPDTKPVRRKNFIYENVKNLRHMEQNMHMKELEGTQNSRSHERKKLNNKYQNIASKLCTNHYTKQVEGHNVNLNEHDKINRHCVENQEKLCRKSSMPIMNKNSATAKKMPISATNNNLHTKQKRKECKNIHKLDARLHENISSDPILLHESTKDIHNDKNTKLENKLMNQGTQTLDTNQINNLYSEGVIRYPSKKVIELKNEQGDTVLKDTTNSSPNQSQENSELPPSKEELNTKLNKECTFTNNKSRIHNNSNNKKNTPPSNYKKGVVPKYIRERKEAQKKEEKAKIEAIDPDCPHGHVPLLESERKETLHILKKSYQDYVNELNLMPIKSDTLRAQQRKAEIEKQLNKLEEGIKVFSKPKVYVKMDA